MKYFSIIVVLILLLIIGGGLTQQLVRNSGNISLPVIQQTNNPDGDPTQITPWKAEQLLIVIMFILFSPLPPGLIPMAIGITALMWFLDWQVRRSKAQKGRAAPDTRPVKVEAQETKVESTS